MGLSDIRMLAIIAIVLTTATVYFIALSIQLDGLDSDIATIAGLDVPAVHCQEDEVIGWIGVDTLGCIHYEEVN